LLLACTFYDGLKADTGHKYNNNNNNVSYFLHFGEEF
jgi:hypothetical protein